MKSMRIALAIMSTLLVFSVISCTKDVKDGTLQLAFDHTVDGEPLVLETKAYQSAAGHPFYVYRLKYYVSQISLHSDDGSVVDFSSIHYTDIENEMTHSIDLGTLPSNNYDRISFTFGLEEADNIDNGLPNTQENVNMEWPIPGDQGYHYMKFEGRYDVNGSGEFKNFNLHTGATKGNQNYIQVSLPFNTMAVDGNHLSITLNMDLMEWLQNPDIYDFDQFGSMIMMNQDAQLILKTNGATVFSIGEVTNL